MALPVISSNSCRLDSLLPSNPNGDSSIQQLKGMRRIFILLFAGGTLLTVFTNYINFTTVWSGEIEENYIDYGQPQIPSPWLSYRLNKTYNFSAQVKFTRYSGDEKFSCTTFSMANVSWGETVEKAFAIIPNLIIADHLSQCDDPLITLTTHGDYRYLDNLVPLVERWNGPISIAIYAPFQDLTQTMYRIAYLRECTSPLIREWISFHIFAEKRFLLYTETKVRDRWNAWEMANDTEKLCSKSPTFNESAITSRKLHTLYYPVNIARNIARQWARTHIVFPSDIELYPSLNFIPNFFKLLKKEENFFLKRAHPYVFVLPIFEIEHGYPLPNTKTDLIKLINAKTAVVFHQFVCEQCHTIPKYKKWLTTSTSDQDELHVMDIVKRRTPFTEWEPIYVSKNDVPLYDGRLSWEGIRDKMPQSFQMCLLDYDYMIFDNAFLIHKPGIKRMAHSKRSSDNKKQYRVIQQINRESIKKYGRIRSCGYGN